MRPCKELSCPYLQTEGKCVCPGTVWPCSMSLLETCDHRDLCKQAAHHTVLVWLQGLKLVMTGLKDDVSTTLWEAVEPQQKAHEEPTWSLLILRGSQIQLTFMCSRRESSTFCSRFLSRVLTWHVLHRGHLPSSSLELYCSSGWLPCSHVICVTWCGA